MKTNSEVNAPFHASDRTHLQIDAIPLNFGGASGPTHFLTVRSLYDAGYLALQTGIAIPALRIRDAPTIVQLVDNQTGWGMEAVPLPTAITLLRLQPNAIIPGANCHGYTFTESQYWIENSAIDELLDKSRSFRRVELNGAEIVVFRDRGNAVHSCRIIRQGSRIRYVGKAGIGAIQETEQESEAARGNRYTEVEYYRCVA